MSLTSTCAPAAANTRAVASPMPIAAPVTIATFPSSMLSSFDLNSNKNAYVDRSARFV